MSLQGEALAGFPPHGKERQEIREIALNGPEKEFLCQ
jgi:hypothetical protein